MGEERAGHSQPSSSPVPINLICAATAQDDPSPELRQIGGYSRGSYLAADHALRSVPGADVQARRRPSTHDALS